LNITWNFGDGQTYFVSNYSNYMNSTSADSSHKFNLPGQYSVQLTAKEMTRNQSNTSAVNVIILATGINVIPIITSPTNGQSINEGVTWFNISRSFVANCTICNNPFLCTGSRNGGFYSLDNRLNCSYVGLSPGSRLVSNGTRVSVNWSMGDGTSYRVGDWYTNYDQIVTFGYYYSTPGIHVATARLSYYV
jgi:hypothetical protein